MNLQVSVDWSSEYYDIPLDQIQRESLNELKEIKTFLYVTKNNESSTNNYTNFTNTNFSINKNVTQNGLKSRTRSVSVLNAPLQSKKKNTYNSSFHFTLQNIPKTSK